MTLVELFLVIYFFTLFFFFLSCPELVCTVSLGSRSWRHDFTLPSKFTSFTNVIIYLSGVCSCFHWTWSCIVFDRLIIRKLTRFVGQCHGWFLYTRRLVNSFPFVTIWTFRSKQTLQHFKVVQLLSHNVFKRFPNITFLMRRLAFSLVLQLGQTFRIIIVRDNFNVTNLLRAFTFTARIVHVSF